MEVTVYSVELKVNGDWEWRYFVTDGQGPDIELSSASVAGAVARCFDARNGLQIASDAADMWLRNGAVERRFLEADDAEELDDSHRVQAFVEQDRENQPIGELLFVGLDIAGVARTAATIHRIDAVRDLQKYVAGQLP